MKKDRKNKQAIPILLVLLQFLWEITAFSIFDQNSLTHLVIQIILSVIIVGVSVFLLWFVKDKSEIVIIILGLVIWHILRIFIMGGYGKFLAVFVLPLLAFSSLGLLVYAVFKRIQISRESLIASFVFIVVVLLLNSMNTSTFFDRTFFVEFIGWIQVFPPIIILSLVWKDKADKSPLLLYSPLSIVAYFAYSLAIENVFVGFPLLATLFWILYFGLFVVTIPWVSNSHNGKLKRYVVGLFLSATGYLLLVGMELQYYQVLTPGRLLEDVANLWFPFVFLHLNLPEKGT